MVNNIDNHNTPLKSKPFFIGAILLIADGLLANNPQIRNNASNYLLQAIKEEPLPNEKRQSLH